MYVLLNTSKSYYKYLEKLEMPRNSRVTVKKQPVDKRLKTLRADKRYRVLVCQNELRDHSTPLPRMRVLRRLTRLRASKSSLDDAYIGNSAESVC